MKARPVKQLDPDGPLIDNMRRVIAVRLDELYGFIPDALDPAEVKRLHDMRIAAKRLRYLLELSEPLFGREIKGCAKVVKGLQDLLGEIHDCDELDPLVRDHLERLRAADAAAVAGSAPRDAKDLDPLLSRNAPHRELYPGLEVLLVHTRARRDLLHSRFVRQWQALERKDFRGRVGAALDGEQTRESRVA